MNFRDQAEQRRIWQGQALLERLAARWGFIRITSRFFLRDLGPKDWN